MPGAAHTLPRRGGTRGGHRASARRRRSRGGVRWDRIGRLALAGVLVAIFCLYISAGLHLAAAIGEEQAATRAQAALRHEYTLLQGRRARMLSTSWIESQARRLGMAYPGEQQFQLRGVPVG